MSRRALSGIILFSTVLALLISFLAAPLAAGEDEKKNVPAPSRKLTPVPAKDVTIDDDFWAPRIAVNAREAVPHQYGMLVKTGRIENFRAAAAKAAGKDAAFQGLWFNDSDVYKWIEAASYVVAANPSAELESQLTDTIAAIAAAQQPDGYLNTFYQIRHPDKIWTCLNMGHELYCAGHLFQAATAHFLATEERSLFDVALKFADLVCNTFGEDKKRGAPGHECIEMGLVDLYRLTGEKRYLETAEYFILERGKEPFIFEGEVHPDGMSEHRFQPEYFQAHAPFPEQKEPVGHSVRALYLYSGATDVYAESGNKTLLPALDAIWDSLYLKRAHITGGLGAVAGIEGFGNDYELPNETAYNESCAAVAGIMWNWRMLQLEGDHRFSDAMERTLYNAFLAGISLDGKRYFYQNPLATHGQHERKEWFGCACCPSNLSRMLASLGNLPYSTSDEGIWIHLIFPGTVKTKYADLKIESEFPWKGIVRITVTPKTDEEFTLFLRQPNLTRETLSGINGKEQAIFGFAMKEGYGKIRRKWKEGDWVETHLDLPLALIRANPLVSENFGKVAMQRGPVVYCMEEEDNPCPDHLIEYYTVRRRPRVKQDFIASLLGGVMKITVDGTYPNISKWPGGLYARATHSPEKKSIVLIPYYAWNNRGAGAMQVWIRDSL